VIHFIDTANGYQATEVAMLDRATGEALIATLDYQENEEGRGYWSVAVRRQAAWGADGELVFRVSERFDRREEDYENVPADADVIDAGDWLGDALTEAKMLLGHLTRYRSFGATLFDGVALGVEWRWADVAAARG